MSRSLLLLALASLSAAVAASSPSDTVPTDVQQPGTQPLEVTDLQNPTQCDNCHGGFDLTSEPAHNWRGSMMAHASRDPLFWATLAVAEQDFDGAGDLCLRCHVAQGWTTGSSTPTDGSALLDSDATGVSCDLCHSMVNPDHSEFVGEQYAPFLANDEENPPTAYHGSGMYVLGLGTMKYGPYLDAQVNHHPTAQSAFHRSPELCATCHDVSNPVVGDLAPSNGAMLPLPDATHSGVPSAPVDQKAAFNNFPFRYGTVERTSSEHALSGFYDLRVSQHATLPPELQAGAVLDAVQAALASTPTGDYVDGTPRTFSCQSCHVPPVTGQGAKQSFAPVRADLPQHDMTGGNYWVPEAMQHMDAQGRLVLGGGLSADEIAGLQAGALRARHNLTRAAALVVEDEGDHVEVEVINLTGHKLMTGFPEGRRAWLRTRWYAAGGALLREDGAYGDLAVTHQGAPLTVRTLLDPHGPNTRVYEVHYGMNQEWAALLLSLGWPADLALEYDRLDGSVLHTLGELAAQPAGTAWPTLHFVLNDTTVSDTRIPPYAMAYDGALERGVVPVPADQYGSPGPGGVYEHHDEVQLSPPAGAISAEIELLYQPTSWEYVQFLALANDGTDPRLGPTGDDLLAAWLATGMAEPVVMASATWSGDGGLLGTPFCFCPVGPCGNDDPLAGCANSSGAGATLTAAGSASVAADDLVLLAANLLPGQPALLFAGDATLSTAGKPFGDGLRCASAGARLLGLARVDANGGALFGPGLLARLGGSAGDLKRFQVTYRDPASPCGSGTNLTHALELALTP